MAKGLWRGEIPYAKALLGGTIREQLLKMLTWHVGVKTDFKDGTGKFGKYLQRRLDPALWALFEKSYSDADPSNTWNALEAMCDLFRQTALQIANHFGFEYPYEDDRRVRAHLQHVRGLPKDATTIY